ncbi:hypothetical protein HDU91_006704 [Kappamyces sp. JEL0680]|nr:hypothetical protein HDU91_006704 [Kappamyces sp. JEL0680]
MVDEITQTDLYLFDPAAPKPQPASSRIPLPSASTHFTIKLKDPKRSYSKKTKHVPRMSDTFVRSFQSVSPTENPAAAPSPSASQDTTGYDIRVESSTQSSPVKSVGRSFAALSSPAKSFDAEPTFPGSPAAAEFVSAEGPKVQPQPAGSPFPEARPPPPDGIYAIALNFLNGPIAECLELDSDKQDRNESLLMDMNSKWLDDLSSQFSRL